MGHSGTKPNQLQQPELREPGPDDAFEVHRLIGNCPPLDANSLYCNLLQCTHFAQTSICAEVDGVIAGFISGYHIPLRPHTLFIWQVAVAPQARGRGVAQSMIYGLLQRDLCHEVNYIETTVTPANKASRALFQSIADFIGCDCEETLMFDRDRHFNGSHDSEVLLRIGPFQTELIGVGPGPEQKAPAPTENTEKTS